MSVSASSIKRVLKAMDEPKVPQTWRLVRLEVPQAPEAEVKHVGCVYLTLGTMSHSITVQEAVVKLNGPRIRLRFDTLVGTGISGALLVPTLAYLLGKDFLLVRKKDDTSNHSAYRVEGTTKSKAKVLFVDDFSCSGDTLAHVAFMLKGLGGDLKIIGEYYYGGSGLSNGGYGQALEWYK